MESRYDGCVRLEDSELVGGVYWWNKVIGGCDELTDSLDSSDRKCERRNGQWFQSQQGVHLYNALAIFNLIFWQLTTVCVMKGLYWDNKSNCSVVTSPFCYGVLVMQHKLPINGVATFQVCLSHFLYVPDFVSVKLMVALNHWLGVWYLPYLVNLNSNLVCKCYKLPMERHPFGIKSLISYDLVTSWLFVDLTRTQPLLGQGGQR
jgi:hypothetical protein